jgi:hypothetical protein
MIEVKGKESVIRVLKDSVSPQGNRLTTFEIEVPRIVWAEILTHSMICRNAASSRAIPFEKMQLQLTAKPVRFGKANKGMIDAGPHAALIKGMYTPEEWWEMAKNSASEFAKGYYEAGYAKQIFNRPTEAYQVIKGVMSATEWQNWYWLRNHSDADPTLEDAANAMYRAHEQSVPQLLQPGEWHLPYVEEMRDDAGKQMFFVADTEGQEGDLIILNTEEAIKVSSARTGAVSFRAVDYGLEQCLRVYDKLVGDDRKHASAMQHQATPMKPCGEEPNGYQMAVNHPGFAESWEPGISHADRDGKLWSAQFCGWIMNRKLIPGENYKVPK